MNICKVISMEPSIYLKYSNDSLVQMIRFKLMCESAANRIEIAAISGNKQIGWGEFSSANGESEHEFYIEELVKESEVLFVVNCNGLEVYRQAVMIKPPRRWEVHVVQASHHDPGYTDLPSTVLRQHDLFLNEAIDIAEQTDNNPNDAKFRILIEQTWSLDHFLKNASPERATKMIQLLREGRFEMTALFGNMTSELCGHEALFRTLYHSAKISKKYDIPLISAEHNDIPGFSWGLSRVLTDAGIKIFCPGLPLYYQWGNLKFRSFWDVERMFGYDAPGAFWWEAPTGKRILFWCNNWGCGGDNRGSLPDLAKRLEAIGEKGYPSHVIRWPVTGGFRDNSPYIRNFVETIKAWNEKWAYPRLISSTNTMFYESFQKIIPADLPVWRGELPGQDYPSGALSTAIPTGVNRQNNVKIGRAEKLASAATLYVGNQNQQVRINEAYEEALWYDEHAWGYHFPAGPAMRASEHEMATYAYKGEAFAHEVSDKSMAYMADQMCLEDGVLHVAVFNETSWSKTAPISIPMREMDNTGSTMTERVDEGGTVFFKGALLNYRYHTLLDPIHTQGRFDLVDVAAGKKISYQIVEITDAFEPVDYAPQRLGLGSGSKRIGGFEDPSILRYDIQFVAEEVPAHGYRSYKLMPRETAFATEAAKDISSTAESIENEYYQITVDNNSGSITSILDKQANRELIDPDGGGFYRFIVRNGNSPEEMTECSKKIEITKTPLRTTIQIKASAHGHPVLNHKVSLYTGIKNIYFESSVFKDPTPLLNAHIAFPFAAKKANFRYESGLSIIEPVRDYLPDAFSDAIAVQNWVRVQNDDYHILWSSHDAPLAGFCKLWPGYVSPAHRCIVDESFRHDPQTTDDYTKNGHIYSQLFNNNFGTNFAVSQTGLAVFRYTVTTGESIVSDAQATKWGWQSRMPFATIFTDRGTSQGKLAPTGQFIRCDCPDISIMTWKAAEDGDGFILRLWNHADGLYSPTISFPELSIHSANLTSCVENDIPEAVCEVLQNAFTVNIRADEILAVRVRFL